MALFLSRNIEDSAINVIYIEIQVRTYAHKIDPAAQAYLLFDGCCICRINDGQSNSPKREMRGLSCSSLDKQLGKREDSLRLHLAM